MRIVIPWLTMLALAPRLRGPEIPPSFELQESEPVELQAAANHEDLFFYVILCHEFAQLSGTVSEDCTGDMECLKALSGDGVALWRVALLDTPRTGPGRLTITLIQTHEGILSAKGRFRLLF